MRIKCASCRRTDFDVDINVAELQAIKVVSLLCPACGESTAVQQRPGGGIEIDLDMHLGKGRG
jgi:hypothetical protein